MKKIHSLLTTILLLILPTQLSYHFWPDYAFVLGRRIDYLSPTLYVTDIIIILLLFCFLIDTVKKIGRQSLSITTIKTYVIQKYLLILALLILLLSVIYSTEVYVSIYQLIRIVGYLFLFYYIRRKAFSIEKIILLLLIGVFAQSVLAIIQFLLQSSVGGVFWLFGERAIHTYTPAVAKISLCVDFFGGCRLFLRPYGTFSHPNVLAGYTLAIISLSFVYQSRLYHFLTCYLFSSQGQKKYLSIIKILIYGFLFTTIAISFSRTVWTLAYLLLVIVLFIKYQDIKKYISNLLLKHAHKSTVNKVIFAQSQALIVLAYVCVIVLPVVLIIFSLRQTTESITMRETLLISAMSIIRDHSITGTGLGTFITALPHYITIRTGQFLQPVHNIYILFLAEAGLLGVVSLTLIIAHSRKVLFYFFTEKRIALLIPLIVLMLIGLVDHYPLTIMQTILLSVVLLSIVYREYDNCYCDKDKQTKDRLYKNNKV